MVGGRIRGNSIFCTNGFIYFIFERGENAILFSFTVYLYYFYLFIVLVIITIFTILALFLSLVFLTFCRIIIFFFTCYSIAFYLDFIVFLILNKINSIIISGIGNSLTSLSSK